MICSLLSIIIIVSFVILCDIKSLPKKQQHIWGELIRTGKPAHSFNITLAFKTRTIQLLLQNITLAFKTRTIQLLLQNITLALKTRTLQLLLQRELLSTTNYRKLSGSSELLQTGWLNKTFVFFLQILLNICGVIS